MSNNFFPSVLYLQDGTFYKGWSLFSFQDSLGEIVFNTGMTGYQEIITDPSYSSQIVVFTYPEIGNTGLNQEDNESNFIHVKGLVAKNIVSCCSNWRSQISLEKYIFSKRIPHIFGIDTRALTKHLRTLGVMNVKIVAMKSSYSVVPANFNPNVCKLHTLDLVKKVTTKSAYNLSMPIDSTSSFHLNFNQNKERGKNFTIVVIDFGVKFNILRRLLSFGCNIFVLPAFSSYNTIIKYKPDGLLLSNGPGDPSILTYSIETVKKLIYFSNIPIFGICMGHQVLNLALGLKTFKLKFGHRGLNHPSGLNSYSEITSQNHGFAVSNQFLSQKTFSKILKINNLNLNDLTIAGVIHNKKPIFSVQSHPEASPGPHDTDYLFKIFIQLIDFFCNYPN
uniref:Carbamoyl phosphate synthase small chain n=1 Tax=Bostrychia moritziana TaxID=103713 RepID=A0A1Z1M743_BOSMO|nr:carbamoyl phosphate synthase small subunit [Bostrychia moritziana]ARW61574.1 carbamoyl phosphate synthase small subunit [Bostrychia moritziana]